MLTRGHFITIKIYAGIIGAGGKRHRGAAAPLPPSGGAHATEVFTFQCFALLSV